MKYLAPMPLEILLITADGCCFLSDAHDIDLVLAALYKGLQVFNIERLDTVFQL